MSDEVQRTLGRVESKLDALVETMIRHLDDDKENFASVKGRVSKMEKKIYWFSGAWAAAGAIAAYLVKGHS